MTFTARTTDEAEALAAELRALYTDSDWTVRVERPLFDGDDFRVVVG